MPASTSGPTGCSVSSSAVTTPKLPPPPRSAHSSSGFSVAEARTRSPSAVTSSAASRLSQARPCLRSSQPEPPPSVRPATPVLDTRPPVVASPCSWVARSTCAHVAPPPIAGDAPLRVDLDEVDPAHVEHDALAQRAAGDGVAAGAHGDLEALRGGEGERLGDVVGGRAARHVARARLDHGVEQDARVLVGGRAGLVEDGRRDRGHAPKLRPRAAARLRPSRPSRRDGRNGPRHSRGTS